LKISFFVKYITSCSLVNKTHKTQLAAELQNWLASVRFAVNVNSKTENL